MKKIKVEDTTVIFFDHRKLIAEAYRTNGSTNYTLRPELFDFRPKKLNDEGTNVEGSQRKRKKRTLADDKTSDEHSFLLEACKAVRAETNLLPQETINTTISRFWETLSSNDFPQFKGANNTYDFQTIEKLIENSSFLVPPGSTFFNYDVSELSNHLNELNRPFDFIVLDPPWRNKYIRRLKRHHLGYNMLDTKQLEHLPLKELVHQNSIVAIWCTNSKQHQCALLEELLPKWKLRLVHALKWLKVNTIGEPIHNPNIDSQHQKQPYEMLYITCHKDAAPEFGRHIKETELLLSIPSIIHSHKPPLLEWYKAYFPCTGDPKCLELFARYLQPHFTSYGLEVLKLMDKRLFDIVS